MNHNKHIATSVATGIAAGSFFITDNPLLFVSVVGGAAVGQYLGPDLDIESRPSNIGGKQILITTLAILTWLNIGGLTSIIVSILSIFLLINKRKNHQDIFIINIFCIIALGVTILVRAYIEPLTSFALLIFAYFTFIMNKKNEHRGATHSIIIGILIFLAGLLFSMKINNNISRVFNTFVLGYTLGFLTHIFIDFLGSKAMMLFYPIIKKKIKPLRLYKIGTKSELLVFISYITLCIGFAIINVI